MDIDFSHRTFKSIGNFGKGTSLARRKNLLYQGTRHRRRLLDELRKNSSSPQSKEDVKRKINQTLTKFAKFCVNEQVKIDGEVYTEQDIQAYIEYLEESLQNDILAAEIAHHQVEQNRQRAIDMKESLRFSREKGLIICPVCQQGHLCNQRGFILCRNGCGMRVGTAISLEQLSDKIAEMFEIHSNICDGAPHFKSKEIGTGSCTLNIYCTVCNSSETVI